MLSMGLSKQEQQVPPRASAHEAKEAASAASITQRWGFHLCCWRPAQTALWLHTPEHTGTTTTQETEETLASTPPATPLTPLTAEAAAAVTQTPPPSSRCVLATSVTASSVSFNTHLPPSQATPDASIPPEHTATLPGLSVGIPQLGTTATPSAAVAAAAAVNPNWQSSDLYKYFDSEDDSPRASWEPQTVRTSRHSRHSIAYSTSATSLPSQTPQLLHVEPGLQPGHLTSPSQLSSVDVEVIVTQPSSKLILPPPPYSVMHHDEADALLYSVLQATEQLDITSEVFETFPTPAMSLAKAADDSTAATASSGPVPATGLPTGPQLAATSKLYEHLNMATVTARLLAALSPDSVVRKRSHARGGQASHHKQAGTRQQIISHMPVIQEPAQPQSSSTASLVELDNTAAATVPATAAGGNATSTWSTQLGREFAHRQKMAAVSYKQQNVAQANGHVPPFVRSHAAFSQPDKCFKVPPSTSEITTVPSLEDRLTVVDTRQAHVSTPGKGLDTPSVAISHSSLFRQEDVSAACSSGQSDIESHNQASSSSLRGVPCDNIMTRPPPGQHKKQGSDLTAAPAASGQTTFPGTRRSPRGVPCPRPGLTAQPTHQLQPIVSHSRAVTPEQSATALVPYVDPKPPLPQSSKAPDMYATTQSEGRDVGVAAVAAAATAGNTEPRAIFQPLRNSSAGDLVMRGARSENGVTGHSKLNSQAWDSWGGARARLLQTMLTEPLAGDTNSNLHSLSAPNNTTLATPRTAFKDIPKSLSSRGKSTDPASATQSLTHRVARSAASASRLSDWTNVKPAASALPVGTSAAACSGWSGHLSMRTITWGAVDRRRRSDINQKMDEGVALPQRSPHLPHLVTGNRVEQGSSLRVQSGPGYPGLRGPHSVSERHLRPRSGLFSTGGVPGQGGYVGNIGKVEEPLVLSLSSPNHAEVQA